MFLMGENLKAVCVFNSMFDCIARVVPSNTVFVRHCWYHLVSSEIIEAQKSISTVHFLMVISQYFTLLVSYCQYWVSSQMVSENKCPKFR